MWITTENCSAPLHSKEETASCEEKEDIEILFQNLALGPEIDQYDHGSSSAFGNTGLNSSKGHCYQPDCGCDICNLQDSYSDFSFISSSDTQARFNSSIESCYCNCYNTCFLHKTSMTRPKGAPNNGATKAELVIVLKKVGLLNDFGRGDGTAIKDLSRATLKEMIKNAGLEAEVDKEKSKRRSVDLHKYMNTRSSNYVVNLEDPTPPSLNTENAAADSEDNSENEEPPSNQEAAVNNPMMSVQPMYNFRGDWFPELKAMGYQNTTVIAPNKAMQMILACIRKPELHAKFIERERNISEGEISAIMFLGASNMLTLAAKFNEVKYETNTCLDLIDDAYARLPIAIFEATALDSSNVLSFIKGLTALEKANGVKVSHPPLSINASRPVVKTAPPPAICFDNCLFDMDVLTEDERSAVLGLGSTSNSQVATNEHTPDPLDDYNLKQLNLANCCCFPIISSRLVESFGQKYDHALWKSKNLGVIAPLNTDAWIMLAGITPDEVKQAHYDADNLIRKVDRLEIDLPFTTAFFGKHCDKGDGFLMGQKDHMAKAEEKRNEFYIKKLWRTHCPYIKCNCQKYTRKKNDCLDGGIKWLDHALWYLLNNADKVWPDLPATARFARISALFRTGPMRTAIIAYIGYLRVRNLIFDMCRRYAADQSANLSWEFGNTKLTDILEKTVRPIKFLIGKTNSTSNSTDSSAYKRKQPMIEDDMDVILPPTVFKKPICITPPVINVSDNSNGAAEVGESVTKSKAGTSRTAGFQGSKITF